MAGRVRKLSFERIQEFHDCYVKKIFHPDNMRKVLIVEKDFASVNQLEGNALRRRGFRSLTIRSCDSDQVKNDVAVRSSGLTDCQKKVLDVVFGSPQYLYCWGRR